MTAVIIDPVFGHRIPRHWRSRGRALAALVILTGACGGNTDPAQSPSATPSLMTEVYTGRLAPGGSGFYSFQANASAVASFTLASLTLPASGRAVEATLTLGTGVPAGEDCNVSSSLASATPGLTPQLNVPLSPGIYCVRIADPGTLTAAVNFAVRIQRP